MDNTLDEKILEAVEAVRKQLDKEYFKIYKTPDGQYHLEQFFGLTLPKQKMYNDGWLSMRVFSKFIDKDYLAIDINDFCSRDGLTVEKKSDKEILLDKIEVYKAWMSNDLAKAIREAKDLMSKLGLNFLEYTDFNSLVKSVQKIVMSSSLPKESKASAMVELSLVVNKIFCALDALNYDKLRKTFTEDYKLFFVVAN